LKTFNSINNWEEHAKLSSKHRIITNHIYYKSISISNVTNNEHDPTSQVTIEELYAWS